jgi:hypothetical protein
MIKVMEFLMRAPHMILEEFGTWWRERDAPDIVADTSPRLGRHVIDLRAEEDSGLAASPGGTPERDGITLHWLEVEADCNAVYARSDCQTRAETLGHTAGSARLVVRDYAQPV